MIVHPTLPLTRPTLGRRQFLFGGAALALAACASSSKDSTGTTIAGAAETAPHTTDANACYTITSDTGAAALQEVLADASVSTEGFNLLWIPPTLTGTKFDLSLAASSVQFFDGAPTATINAPEWHAHNKFVASSNNTRSTARVKKQTSTITPIPRAVNI